MCNRCALNILSLALKRVLEEFKIETENESENSEVITSDP